MAYLISEKSRLVDILFINPIKGEERMDMEQFLSSLNDSSEHWDVILEQCYLLEELKEHIKLGDPHILERLNEKFANSGIDIKLHNRNDPEWEEEEEIRNQMIEYVDELANQFFLLFARSCPGVCAQLGLANDAVH